MPKTDTTTPRDEALRLARAYDTDDADAPAGSADWQRAAHHRVNAETLARALIEACERETQGDALDRVTANLAHKLIAQVDTLTAERDSIRAELAASQTEVTGLRERLERQAEWLKWPGHADAQQARAERNEAMVQLAMSRAELAAAQAERDEAREANAQSNREWLATAQQVKAQRDEARADCDAARRERELLRSTLANDNDSLTVYLAQQAVTAVTTQRDEARLTRECAEFERNVARAQRDEARREVERMRPVYTAVIDFHRDGWRTHQSVTGHCEKRVCAKCRLLDAIAAAESEVAGG